MLSKVIKVIRTGKKKHKLTIPVEFEGSSLKEDGFGSYHLIGSAANGSRRQGKPPQISEESSKSEAWHDIESFLALPSTRKMKDDEKNTGGERKDKGSHQSHRVRAVKRERHVGIDATVQRTTNGVDQVGDWLLWPAPPRSARTVRVYACPVWIRQQPTFPSRWLHGRQRLLGVVETSPASEHPHRQSKGYVWLSLKRSVPQVRCDPAQRNFIDLNRFRWGWGDGRAEKITSSQWLLLKIKFIFHQVIRVDRDWFHVARANEKLSC